MDTKKAFHRLWRDLGAPAANEAAEYADLVGRYAEPHRRYHTLTHIAEGLEDLLWVKARTIMLPESIEMAWWYHDAVYFWDKKGSEEASAVLATEVLARNGFAKDFIRDVAALVRSTAHGSKMTDAMRDVGCDTLLDVDLAIFGRSEQVFDDYERGIRFEYRTVPVELFRKKRLEVMSRFLQAKFVYRTSPFRTKYEDAAKANLARSVARLQQGVVLE